MADKMKQVAAVLRGEQQMPTQTRGYQLYKTEAEMNGETAMPYDKWLKTRAPKLDAPQQ